MQEYITQSEQETMDFGIRLSEKLKGGDILAVTGDLGSGKTALVKGIAQGFSIDDPVTSPTFTLVHTYHGPSVTLHHFDVYRVSNEDGLFDIGFEEYLYGGDICVIEWADLIRPILPAHTKWVHLQRTDNGADERKISLEGMEQE